MLLHKSPLTSIFLSWHVRTLLLITNPLWNVLSRVDEGAWVENTAKPMYIHTHILMPFQGSIVQDKGPQSAEP